MAEVSRQSVPSPAPLTTEELEDRKAYYFMRDTAIYRALDELAQLRADNLALNREINELRDGIRLMIQGLEKKDPRAVPIELRTFAKKLGLIR
jgi:hypothetical protein